MNLLNFPMDFFLYNFASNFRRDAIFCKFFYRRPDQSIKVRIKDHKA